MLMCCSSCVRLQDQNTDAADVDADDVAFEDDEEAAGDGEGGDALGPRAQASKPAPKMHGSGGLRGWRVECGPCLPQSTATKAHAAVCPATRPSMLSALPQIINTACWQSSKECGLLLGALARALPIGGKWPAA